MKRYLLSLIGSEHRTHGFYARLAELTSEYCGRSKTFTMACLIIIVWMITGPIFQFSDTWQLIINTGTTIVTFLMMFLLQNSHNRDMDGVHAKLDALLLEMSRLRCDKE
jgi:low affinity Fe/Cu permease